MMKKLLKITEIATLPKSASFPNYQRYQYQIFMAQTKDLYEDCVKIFRSYLFYFPRNKPSKSVNGRLGRFIVLNDSASPKMVFC